MPFPGIDAARKTFVDDNHFPRFRRHFEFIFGLNFASINVVAVGGGSGGGTLETLLR